VKIRFEGGVLHGKAVDTLDPPLFYRGAVLEGDQQMITEYILVRWEIDGVPDCAYRPRDLTEGEKQALRNTRGNT
jgi:hypothetical protein